jgi:oligopeptide/dipeptide ABC transporter ATP-binding protein
VDGVRFFVGVGETVALVGESGCGKSVTALSLARLVPEPGYHAGGEILFDGTDILRLSEGRLAEIRGSDISYVFQEPATSLNPVFRVGYQIAEAVRLHRRGADAWGESIEMMRMVGLPEPERRLRAYPHEMSGGMQQRVMIAMALACRPRLLVADEPTTALDVTIQAQIMELLRSLQERLHMAVLLITHNLGLVADTAHRVYVMYAGRIVEWGPTASVLDHPAHPYTRALLEAVPRLDRTEARMRSIEGTVPHPGRWPAGCRFHPRCPRAREICGREDPAESVVDEGHGVRCHFWK